MYHFSEKSLENLESCDKRLQELFHEVIKYFDCSIICGHREKLDQDIAYAAGKSQIQWPNSKHNSMPSQAVDVIPYPVDWEDTDRMQFFAGFVMGTARGLGIEIRWGGDWDRDTTLTDQKFNDYPHFELAE